MWFKALLSPPVFSEKIRKKSVCYVASVALFALMMGTFSTVEAEYHRIDDVTAKTVGSKFSISDYNTIRTISSGIFYDDATGATGIGEVTDPVTGACPATFSHVDFDNDTTIDDGECWRGVKILDGNLLTSGLIDGVDVSSLQEQGADAGTSGAAQIGVFDEFSNSSATNIQDVLDDLDLAISSTTLSAISQADSNVTVTDLGTGAVTVDVDGSTVTTTNSAGVGVTGNITVSGTVDGVDVSELDVTEDDLSDDDTDDLSEGTTNLYFTDARAVDAVGSVDEAEVWGDLTGTLSNQTDLQTALNDKLDDSQLNDSATTTSNVWSASKISSEISAGNSDNQNLFETVAVSSGTNPVAETATDTLNLTAGSNVTITGEASTDTITIAATDTTVADGLSCASDEILKWNGSAWTCSADVNTDDQTAVEVVATDEFDNSDSTNVQDVLDDLDAVISTNETNILTNASNIQDNADEKADRVGSVTVGDFAGLDANGNLTDSGSRASDFATAGHGHVIGDVTGLQTALDDKVDENTAITGATHTKITYDSKGLVTAGSDATTADISDSTDARYVTDAQLTVIGNTSGTNTGDQNVDEAETWADIGNAASEYMDYRPGNTACANGEILIWNNTATQWECGSDSVGTDDQTAAEVVATDEFANSDSTNVQDVLDDLDAVISDKANIAAPTFTGDAKAVTATAADSDTSIATTAFVQGEISTATSGYLRSVVEDETPQLGGNLDTNGNFINFDTDTGILDDSGKGQLVFDKSASAVNFFAMQNAAAGNPAKLAAYSQTEANVDMQLETLGSGAIYVADEVLPAGSVSQTLGGFNYVSGVDLGSSARGFDDLYVREGHFDGKTIYLGDVSLKKDDNGDLTWNDSKIVQGTFYAGEDLSTAPAQDDLKIPQVEHVRNMIQGHNLDRVLTSGHVTTQAMTVGNILPEMAGATGTVSVRTLGSPEKKFANIFADAISVGVVAGDGSTLTNLDGSAITSGLVASTVGGSGVNNAGTLTWGDGGTLGTAAYTASSAYATAAQGTAADDALPADDFTDTAVISKQLTGFNSGAGTVTATDTILQAINKLDGNVALKANTESPTFTGDAKAVTATAADNDTSIATTAFVQGEISTATSGLNTDNQVLSWNGTSGELTISDGNTVDLDGRYQRANNVVSKTADYSATASDAMIFCNASSVAGENLIITLPTVASMTSGQEITVKKTDASIKGCKIETNGSEEYIDGAQSVTLNTQFTAYTLVFFNNQWWIK